MILLTEVVSRDDAIKNAEKNRKDRAKHIKVKIIEPPNSYKATLNRWFVEDDYILVVAEAEDRNGSRDKHTVNIAFRNILKNLIDIVSRDKEHLVTRDTVRKAISRTFRDDTLIYYGCDCEDFTYRYRYYATQSNSVIGSRETRRPKITNPDDDIGYLCKHLLALVEDKDLLRGKLVTQVLKYIETNYNAILDKYNLDKHDFVFVNRRGYRH